MAIKGSLMGKKALPEGGVQEIVYIEQEQRPDGGPAAPSMISVLNSGGRRVAGYVPWINYFDLDESARQEPGAWEIVEPAIPYEEVVEWRPYGVRAGGRAGSIELATVIADLVQTPAKLRRTLGMLGDAVEKQPAPGEWSVAEVTLHIIAADSIFSPRVYQILAQPGITVADMDVTETQRVLARANMPLLDRLTSFEARRKELVATLDQITAAELDYTAEHSRDGKITILDICRSLAAHELEHKKQIEAAATALGFNLG